MSSLPLLSAFAAALLVFALAARLLHASRRRQELDAALHALAAMKRSEFFHHVGAVLAQRGLRHDDPQRIWSEDAAAISMTRGSARYLVQCRQDDAHRLDSASVRAFADEVRARGAEGGIMVTTGAVDGAARRRAGMSGIELMAGNALWRQLRPLVPLDLHQEVTARASRRYRGRLLAALLLAALAGVATWLLLSASAEGTAPPARPEPEPAVAQPRPAADAAQAGTPAAPAAGSSGPEAPAVVAVPSAPAEPPLQLPDPTLGEEDLAARRASAAERIRAFEGIASAVWSSRSTLLLTLTRDVAGPSQDLLMEQSCAELARFEELRYTRLQVQIDGQLPPAADSAAPGDPATATVPAVRWRLCR